MKRLIFAFIALFLVTGCSKSHVIDLDNDGLTLWAKETMVEGILIEANKSVKMSIEEIDEETITIKLLNQSCWDCGYAQDFEIHTLIDDVWYKIPTADTYVEKEPMGNIIEGYVTQIKVYKVSEKYGVLPSGEYRIVVEGHTANFTVK